MAKKVKNAPKKRKRKKFFSYLSIVLIIVSLVTLGFIFVLDVIPFSYLIFIILGFVLFDLIMIVFLLSRGWKRRMFGTVFSIISLIGMFVAIFYLGNTYDFLKKIVFTNYNTENYNVIVLKNSNYKALEDLNGKRIGLLYDSENEGIVKARKHLEEKVASSYQNAEDLDDLVNLLLSKKVDAILVENAKKRIMEEEHADFLEIEKVIYDFSVDIEFRDKLLKEVDITSKPFNIFISGIDTYGKISSVSRSDVNMVMTVNPTTHEIHLTSIPRDYYVKLNGIDTNYKDKLTHAGIHGIDTSVKTVEDLLSIDINYYMKVNFTSLVTLVNTLEGIDVELNEEFRAYYNENGEQINYNFSKGINHLNGKQALAFSRERKSLAAGDIARIEHQQLVLEGLLKKMTSKDILIKYNDILDSIEGKFVTNLGTKNITNFVKEQMTSNFSWNVSSYTLKGENSSNYTYSYKSKKSYVMEPDIESIEEAKQLINALYQK